MRAAPWLPLAAGIGLVLLLALAEGLFFKPGRERLGEEIRVMRETIVEAERVLPSVPGLRNRLSELEAERGRFLSLVGEKPPGDRFLAELRRAVAAQGVKLDRVLASYAPQPQEGYALAQYRVELAGRFPALVEVLRTFRPEGMVYWVPEMSFRSASGRLEATVVFAVPYGGGR